MSQENVEIVRRGQRPRGLARVSHDEADRGGRASSDHSSGPGRRRSALRLD